MQLSGLYGKPFQNALTAHLLRTALSRFLVDGAQPHPEQTDFDTEPNRVALVAAQDVVRTIGHAAINAQGRVSAQAVGHTIEAMILAGHVQEDMGRLALGHLQLLYGAPGAGGLTAAELDADYYGHHLPLFLRERRTFAAVQDSQAHNPEGLSEALQHAARSSSGDVWCGEVDSVDAELPPPVEPIPTGLLSLDAPMGGGPGRKETVLVCAGTGIGKTSLMLNIRRGAAVLGYRAALWTLELPGSQIRQRNDSLCSRVDYETVRRAGLDGQTLTREEIQALVRQGKGEWTGADAAGRMLLFDYSEQEVSVSRIDRDLTMAAERGLPIDVACIDWLECIGLPPRNRRQRFEHEQQHQFNELRQRIEHIAGEVTNLAKRHNAAVWLTTQTGFNVQNKSVVRMADKAEAKGASRKMSWFLGVGMSPEDEERGIVVVTADKTRDGRFFTTQLRRRLDQQRFEDLDQQAEQTTATNLVSL